MIARIDRMLSAWEAGWRGVERSSVALANYVERMARRDAASERALAELQAAVLVLKEQVRSLQMGAPRGTPAAQPEGHE